MSRLEEIKQRFKAMNELPSFKKLAPTKYSMFGIKTSERGVFPLDDPEFIDVIGNIYEHPYLLKDDPS